MNKSKVVLNMTKRADGWTDSTFSMARFFVHVYGKLNLICWNFGNRKVTKILESTLSD